MPAPATIADTRPFIAVDAEKRQMSGVLSDAVDPFIEMLPRVAGTA